MSATQTWRVIRENEAGALVTETLPVDFDDRLDLLYPWVVTTDDGAAGGATPRDAVARYARVAMWTTVEILAPGERPRANLVAEIERLRSIIAAAHRDSLTGGAP